MRGRQRRRRAPSGIGFDDDMCECVGRGLGILGGVGTGPDGGKNDLEYGGLSAPIPLMGITTFALGKQPTTPKKR